MADKRKNTNDAESAESVSSARKKSKKTPAPPRKHKCIGGNDCFFIVMAANKNNIADELECALDDAPFMYFLCVMNIFSDRNERWACLSTNTILSKIFGPECKKNKSPLMDISRLLHAIDGPTRLAIGQAVLALNATAKPLKNTNITRKEIPEIGFHTAYLMYGVDAETQFKCLVQFDCISRAMTLCAYDER